MKILFIDDEEIIRELFLESHKQFHKIDLAEDGKIGLKKALTNSYDLIVSDISLPQMNGLELIETIRKNRVQTPFIVITGDSDIQLAIDMFRLGAIDFFLKPFRMEVLLSRIEKITYLEKENTVQNDTVFFNELYLSTKIAPKIKKIQTIVKDISGKLENIGLIRPEDIFSIKIVLYELICNSIEHGIAGIHYYEKKRILENEEDYYERVDEICATKTDFVDLKIEAKPGFLKMIIEDNGAGFQIQEVPDPAVNPTLNMVSGRGIFLSKMNLSSIKYNQKGNRVEVIKTWNIA